MKSEIVSKYAKITRKSDGQDVALAVDFFYQDTMRCSYFISLEERKIVPLIVPCFDYKGDVKTDGTYDILVKVENEMKKEFGEFNAAAETIGIEEKEFARLINHFKLKDELLKEIANSINELGDASVYNFAKSVLLVNFS